MLLSKAFIGQKAEELNFNRDTLEKVVRLTEILNFLNTDTLTKDCLALKGGTAINLTIISKTLNHKTFQATQVYSRLDISPVREALNTVVEQFESFR